MNKKLIILSISIFSILPAMAMESQKIGTHIPAYNLMLQAAKQELEKNPLALHRACKNGDCPAAQILIEAGAPVNARNALSQIGRTPLHLAACAGHLNVAQLLIAAGADVHARDCDCRTPVFLAAEEGKTETTQFLIDRGADVNVQGNDGNTPLCLAAIRGQTEDVQLLLKHGADVNVRNHCGRRPLRLAVRSTEIVQLLLSRFHLPQSIPPTTAETTYPDGGQEAWDLKSLALMNILSNIEAYDEENLHHTMQTYPTLLTNFKKILPFVDLYNKKIRRLLALSDTSGLADYCEYTFVKHMKDLISQDTALDFAARCKQVTCVRLLEAVKNAESFDQLPEEIKQVAICQISQRIK